MATEAAAESTTDPPDSSITDVAAETVTSVSFLTADGVTVTATTTATNTAAASESASASASASSAVPSPSDSPTSPDVGYAKSGFPHWATIVFIVGLVAIFVLLGVGCCFWRRRRWKKKNPAQQEAENDVNNNTSPTSPRPHEKAELSAGPLPVDFYASGASGGANTTIRAELHGNYDERAEVGGHTTGIYPGTTKTTKLREFYQPPELPTSDATRGDATQPRWMSGAIRTTTASASRSISTPTISDGSVQSPSSISTSTPARTVQSQSQYPNNAAAAAATTTTTATATATASELAEEADAAVQELGLISMRKKALVAQAKSLGKNPKELEGRKGDEYSQLLDREVKVRKRLDDIEAERRDAAVG